MQFVVSTHALQMVVEVDEAWNVVGHRLLGEGYHFGAVVSPDGGSLLSFHDTRAGGGPWDPRLRRFDLGSGDFQLVDDRPLDEHWRDIHQIATYGDRLLVTNTGRNSLELCDADFNPIDRFHFNGAQDDRNHINSVFLCGADALILLHNKSTRLSELAVCRIEGDRLRYVTSRSLWHRCCHNFFVDDGRLVYNASADGIAIGVDLTTSRINAERPFGSGHNKGLSVTDDALVVGISEFAERSKRGSTNASLAVLDRQTLEPIATVDLAVEGLGRPTGNLNEVRRIDAPDPAAGRPEAESIDWRRVRLGASEPIGHFARQAYLQVSLPVRRLRKRLKR